jgi:hypothetical protein
MTRPKKEKDDVVFTGVPANVSYSLTATINMGNFESLKIQVGLSMPCKATKLQIDNKFKAITAHVEELLDIKVKELTGGSHGTNQNVI